MTKKFNGYAKWALVTLAFLGIMWNAVTLHYGVKENAAVLRNDVTHLKEDVADIKLSISGINSYLLREMKPE